MNERSHTMRRLLLRVPNRRRVYDAVVATPGIHARRISRELDMALGVVEHHVRTLERHDVIYAQHTGRRRTLFATEHIDATDAPILHGLRKEPWRRTAAALLDGERGVRGLSRELGEPPSSVSYRLGRMRDAGLLENIRVGRESLYLLRDPEGVRRVLARYFVPPAGDGLGGLVRRARSHQAPPDVVVAIP